MSRSSSAYPPLEKEDVLNHCHIPPHSMDPTLLQAIKDYHLHQQQQNHQLQQEQDYCHGSHMEGQLSHNPPPYNPDYVRKMAVVLTCKTNHASSSTTTKRSSCRSSSTSHSRSGNSTSISNMSSNSKKTKSPSYKPSSSTATITEAMRNNNTAMKEPILLTEITRPGRSTANKVQGTRTTGTPPPAGGCGGTLWQLQQQYDMNRVRDEPSSIFQSMTSIGSSAVTSVSSGGSRRSMEKTKQVAVKSYHAIQHTTVKASQKMSTLYQEIKERRPTVRRSTTSMYGIAFSFRDR